MHWNLIALAVVAVITIGVCYLVYRVNQLRGPAHQHCSACCPPTTGVPGGMAWSATTTTPWSIFGYAVCAVDRHGRCCRQSVVTRGRRSPTPAEGDVLGDGMVVLELADRGGRVRVGARYGGGDRLSVLARVPPVAARRTLQSGTASLVSVSARPRALFARLPEHVAAGVCDPRQYEQQVGQPVEVLRGQCWCRREMPRSRPMPTVPPCV